MRWQLALRTRSAHLPPLPVRAKVLPRRLLLQGAGVLVAAWFPLLGFGVAGLSPLSDGVVSRPAPPVERSAVRTSQEQFQRASAVSTPPAMSRYPKPAFPACGWKCRWPSIVAWKRTREQAPEQEAPEGDTGGNGRVPGTGGVAVSLDTGGNGQVPTTGGVAAPSD